MRKTVPFVRAPPGRGVGERGWCFGWCGSRGVCLAFWFHPPVLRRRPEYPLAGGPLGTDFFSKPLFPVWFFFGPRWFLLGVLGLLNFWCFSEIFEWGGNFLGQVSFIRDSGEDIFFGAVLKILGVVTKCSNRGGPGSFYKGSTPPDQYTIEHKWSFS